MIVMAIRTVKINCFKVQTNNLISAVKLQFEGLTVFCDLKFVTTKFLRL